MKQAAVRVFLVDDYAPWRQFFACELHKYARFQVVGQATDGMEALRKAQDLQPDLILLDIGLPLLNGIEVARKLPQLSPTTKILFISENSSPEIVEQALRHATGYMLKSDAGRELLAAIDSVTRGKQFVSSSLSGKISLKAAEVVQEASRHQVGFYDDDRHLLDDVTQFIGSAIKAGNAAIVVATECHREALLPRLQSYGLAMDVEIAEGRYVALDAATALATFMRNGMPDPLLFGNVFEQHIRTAAKAANGDRRVAIFGECAHLLSAQGNADAAIEIERLASQLIKAYDVNILCGYIPSYLPGGMERNTLLGICAQHSSVHCRP